MTSTPTGVLQRRRIGGLDVRYVRTPVPGPLARRGWTHETTFSGVAAAATLASGADLVHAWLYGDGYGAAQALRLRPRPLVLKLTGTVLPDRVARLPVDDRLLRSALARADEVWCNSTFAREEMAGFGVPMHVVPAGVDLERFVPGGPAREPVVLSASAPGDPRKRLVDVFDAWPAVRAAVPEARLRVAGAADARTRQDLLDRLPGAAAASVTFLGDVRDDDLVAEYQQAAVTVAPAVHEALGLTTIESLACGTPVAGARSGATAELVEDDRTGALFGPADPEDAADAILRALALSSRPGTVAACRDAATPYGWDRVAAVVADRYQALLARG